MTADEIIESALNRAGQTISDLPQNFPGGPEAYSEEAQKQALCEAWSWYLPLVASGGDMMGILSNGRNGDIAAQYILHLTDVIDRLVTAVENLAGERDWLKEMARNDGCPTCANHKPGDPLLCSLEKWTQGADGNCGNYEYSGVPEDWDDERA